MATKKQRLTGPGLVLDRSCKKGKLKIRFDASPNGFVAQAQGAKEKLSVQIIPGNGDIEPIEVLADPKLWAFQLENAHVPKDRLADLERLIAEEIDVHIVISYTPQQENLPGLDGSEGKDPKDGKDPA
jgi:hypothetical protein